MDNKEFENRHQGTVRTLRIIGWILLPIGLTCVIIGMVSFMTSFGSGGFPPLFYLVFAGFPFLAGGGICLSLGYHRKMTEFMATQTAPVAKDFTNYMVDGTSDSVARVAGKIANEIKGTGKNGETIEGVTANTCARCGHVNPATSKFCAKCGAPLTRACPHCGAVNDDGAKFCNNCGKELYTRL
jgi:RNA polymerase subunit RPABC4/transcription elongation factor Spt4